jgi:hypothetical protein
MVSVRAVIILVFICVAPIVVSAAPTTNKTIVLHITTVPGDDPGRFYSIARMTVTALDKGHRVIMLFDGEGARSVKLGSWYGGDTSLLDKLDIPDSERMILAKDLGLTTASTPSNYGELMRLFRGKGVALYVNRDMMRPLDITEEEYDTVFVPVGPDKMLEIMEDADMYVSY